MIHVPDGTARDDLRFHHTSHTWESVQFKTYILFISAIFHLIFPEHSCPWVTESTESETKSAGFDYKSC